MGLAQVAQPRGASPVNVAASIFRGRKAPVDSQALAQWADGGGQGPMHTLLFDARQGFLSALLRDWGTWIEARELKAGEPPPEAIGQRLGPMSS